MALPEAKRSEGEPHGVSDSLHTSEGGESNEGECRIEGLCAIRILIDELCAIWKLIDDLGAIGHCGRVRCALSTLLQDTAAGRLCMRVWLLSFSK